MTTAATAERIQETPQAAIRAYEPSCDEGLVFDSWKKQIRGAEPFNEWHYTDVFGAHRTQVIEPLVERCKPLISCHADHPTQIFGYCCAERQDKVLVMHMIYMRHGFRGYGFAKALLERCLGKLEYRQPLRYTHKTAMTKRLCRKWNAVYDPYRITPPNT